MPEGAAHDYAATPASPTGKARLCSMQMHAIGGLLLDFADIILLSIRTNMKPVEIEFAECFGP